MRHRFIQAAFPSILALAIILGASGCGKKAAPAVTPQPAPTAEAPAQPAPQAQPSAQPAVQPKGEPDLAEINRAVIRWLVRNKRRPANFEDFAATSDIPIPPAPPGKKYVLGANMHVQLVNL